MSKKNYRRKQLTVAIASALTLPSFTVFAQEDGNKKDAPVEEVIVTGSRLTRPGLTSSSPTISINAEEIGRLQEGEFEAILRSLPATIPGDNPGVNNGTDGAATIDLRGLGPERNLVLMNGKRLVPFNFDGRVDTNIIPTALIKRVDVVTGGASAAYGSDAIAGAVNIILKDDFEGLAIELGHRQTGESDGKADRLSLTAGSNFADDRGNAVLSFTYASRDGVTLGQRPLGLLGINSETGSGFEEFKRGEPPRAPEAAGCGGPNVVDITGSGSTTAIPTRFAIPGTPVAAQFRDNGSLGEACSLFNFNPFNYYQTPFEKYSATALIDFEINDHSEFYASMSFASTAVRQQIAPSGTFGARFDLPLYNPLISDEAKEYIITNANAAVTGGTLLDGGNWQDLNNNGVVDGEDTLNVQLRRRTLELGPRSTGFDATNFQIVSGVRGDISENWKYDTYYSYGESNRTNVRDGYTNLTNIQNALMTRDGVTCENGDASCVPINLFGGFGTITDEMAGYATALALRQQKYEQEVISAQIEGSIEQVQLPTANEPAALVIGYEHRSEDAIDEPDECLKLAPASCQGGAGGNLLPIAGGYKVDELFFEGFLPIADGLVGAEDLNLEIGYRTADYTTVGEVDSWKIGLNWSPVESVFIRIMQQEANRAPNVGELFSPLTTALRNASQDPCSIANADNIDNKLRELCISTGMTDAQVGVVQDIVSSQVNTIEGSDPNALPDAESADTFTAGVVFTPNIPGLDGFELAIDYYDIEIEDIIGLPSAQEGLDGCYKLGIASECAQIRRVDGDLTSPDSGVELFTTNLNFERAKGIEVKVNFGLDLNDYGTLSFSANIHQYLTQESQSRDTTPVIECKGFYGTSCDPISEISWVQRTTWAWNDLAVSARWRHLGAIDIQTEEFKDIDPRFTSIDAHNYLDLSASYNLTNSVKLSVGVDNLLDKEPPVVGNDVGDTSSNSGNTFPGNYDTLGRIYRATVNFDF